MEICKQTSTFTVTLPTKHRYTVAFAIGCRPRQSQAPQTVKASQGRGCLETASGLPNQRPVDGLIVSFMGFRL